MLRLLLCLPAGFLIILFAAVPQALADKERGADLLMGVKFGGN